MAAEYIPQIISQTINRTTKDTITHEQWNELFNLLITQGDHTAYALATLIGTDMAAVESDIAQAQTDIDTLEAQMTAANIIISGHTSSININAADIDQLESDLGDLETTVEGYNTSRIQADASHDAAIANLVASVDTHKSSNDHDGRYYTKDIIDEYLSGGDTVIKEETFIIVSADNGDGTFTYSDKDSINIVNSLGDSGEQQFSLQEGNFTLGANRVELIINDTLRRTEASGGITEISEDTIQLTNPEGVGSEITIRYYERIALAGEYNIRYSAVQPGDGLNVIWFKDQS